MAATALPALEQFEVTTKARSLWEDALHRLTRNRLAVAGLVAVLFLGACAVLAPAIAPYSPREQNTSLTFKSPSLFHGFLNPASPAFLDFKSRVMGTDNLGRDWFSRIIYGARLSLSVGFFAQAVVLTIGLPIGMAAGYFGGKVDNFLMRFTDLVYAFPDFLFIILLRTALGGGLFTLFLIIGLVTWVDMARLVRGQILSLKGREFVEAARAVGSSDREIMVRHLFPNILGPIIVVITFGIPRAVFVEAALSFIGIGIGAGSSSWGSMVQEGYSAIFAFPYLVMFPAIAIAALMLSFTFIGDGLRDALDPRTR